MSEEKTRKKKRKFKVDAAWQESKALLWQHRKRLGISFAMMVVGRLAGLALPASSKFLIDQVVGKHRWNLLLPLAIGAGLATLVQAATSFGLSQLLGVAAQREIAEMRKRLHAHVLRLPTRFFDSTKSGEPSPG